MTNPDSEGYYAFEGCVRGLSVEKVQLVALVRTNSVDDQYYAYRLTGYPLKVAMMSGTWVKLRLPWDVTS